MALVTIAPYKQHHYMGHYATSTAANTAWTGVGFTSDDGVFFYDTALDNFVLRANGGWEEIYSAKDHVVTASAGEPIKLDGSGYIASAQLGYAVLLAGRAGGQTIIGGTASGDDLTLTSTSNATKGQIIVTDEMYMSNKKIVNVLTPTADTDAATKGYVDGLIQGVDWLEAVDYDINYVKAGVPTGTGATNGERCLDTTNFDLYSFTTSWALTGACGNGDRYIFKTDGDDTSGNAGTHTRTKKIYEYNGSTLDETTAEEGMAVWVKDTDDSMYVYNGTEWVLFGSVVNHNSLSGLQGGTTSQYYHLNSAQHAALVSGAGLATDNPHSVTLDQAYNAGASIDVDGGGGTDDLDIVFSGAYSFVVDMSGISGDADGFFIEDVTNSDYIRATRHTSATAGIDWSSDVRTIAFSASGGITYTTTGTSDFALVSAGELTFVDGHYNGDGTTGPNGSIPLADAVATDFSFVCNSFVDAINKAYSNGGSANNLQQVYNASDNTVTMTAALGVVAWTGASNQNSAIMTFSQIDTTNNPNVIEISNAGSGSAIELQGAGSRLIRSASGDLTIQTVTANDVILDGYRDVLFKNNTALVATLDAAGLGFVLGTSIKEFSIDGAMTGNSDDAVPTEKAVVTYVAAQDFPTIYSAAGTPEGTQTADPGDIYIDTTNILVYIKANGTGNVDWTLVG